MPKPKPKRRFLEDIGALHRHPERVRAELFDRHRFFDPLDKVQVKYEMLRAHAVNEHSIISVAEAFGFSRETYYAVLEAFETRGVLGLVDGKAGRPKGRHRTPDAEASRSRGGRHQHDRAHEGPERHRNVFRLDDLGSSFRCARRGTHASAMRSAMKREENPQGCAAVSLGYQCVVPATLNGQRDAAEEGNRSVGAVDEVAMRDGRDVPPTCREKRSSAARWRSSRVRCGRTPAPRFVEELARRRVVANSQPLFERGNGLRGVPGQEVGPAEIEKGRRVVGPDRQDFFEQPGGFGV